ncbi:MAG: hypothetical protein E6J71_23405 [Deltaproteobacteria bacterium]|nr:MAG: hypothetical protein E6J71_23405 [Deltaproteobacteria bacterium]
MNLEHIRVLLDADAMRDLLGAIPLLADGTAGLSALSLDRLWVKPGRHFHASYRVTLATEAGPCEMRASAALLRADREPADFRPRALRGTRPPRPAGWDVDRATARVDSPPLQLALFPWDARLPTLPLALDPARVEATLGSVRLRSCSVAGYWPGVRCQLRYERRDAPGAVYGKVFPDGAGGAIALAQEAVTRHAAETPFAMPRVRAYLPQLNLLLTDPVEGEPLLDLLRTAPTGELMARVATALAAFHALPRDTIERRFGPADDLAVVRSWVGLIGALFPRLASPLESALAALERHVPPDGTATPALVHRDFYDKQVLVGPSRIGLLDLDTVCQGDGEIDVGNFSAHLVLRAVQGGAGAETAEPLAEALVAAYRAERPTADPHRIGWYRGAALLRLACVYALRPWWHALAPVLLDGSRQSLN